LTAAFDASVLIYVFDENAKAPLDPATGKVVTRCKERVDNLIETLQRDGEPIVVPTPALAEVLVHAQEGAPERLRIMSTSKHFRIAPFDERAAVEFAAVQASRSSSSKTTTPRIKAKFDDQIVAIAAVAGATVIYSDDPDIKRLAAGRMEVKGIADLPLPPEHSQTQLPL
jgi:predicted nucleic acid-binding protein